MFILLIYRDPRRWDELSAAERAAAALEHDEFQRSVPEMAFVETLTERPRRPPCGFGLDG